MIAELAVAAAAATGGAAAQQETGVLVVGRAFTPSPVTVLVGESVRWSNQDNAAHTVTAEDGSFDSGRIEPGGQFARDFARPGTLTYKCSLHRFMRGRVEVVGLALSGPERPVPAGATATLTGRAPQERAGVTLERLGAGTVATATSQDDGRFSFRVPADAPARYRVRTGDLTSAVVAVDVAPLIRIAARRAGRGVSVRLHVPGQAGARILLERHERERFGFVRLRELRLGREARVRVFLPTHRRLRLRARLTRPIGGYARSVGSVVVVPRAGGAARPGHAHG